MSNLGWGLQMTVLGMGIVFALLAVLWGVLTVVMRFDRAPVALPAPGAAGAPVAVASEGAAAPAGAPPGGHRGRDLDAELVAAIVAAALAHKAARRQEAAPEMRSFLPGSHLYASRWVASGRMRQNTTWQRGSR